MRILDSSRVRPEIACKLPMDSAYASAACSKVKLTPVDTGLPARSDSSNSSAQEFARAFVLSVFLYARFLYLTVICQPLFIFRKLGILNKKRMRGVYFRHLLSLSLLNQQLARVVISLSRGAPSAARPLLLYIKQSLNFIYHHLKYSILTPYHNKRRMRGVCKYRLNYVNTSYMSAGEASQILEYLSTQLRIAGMRLAC